MDMGITGKLDYKHVSVDPAAIDVGSLSPFRVRRHLPGEIGQSAGDRKLTASLNELGLLHPPLIIGVAESPNYNFTAVYGHRRIAAAACAGLKEIEAQTPASPVEDAHLLYLRVEELRYALGLTELERIIALDKILKFQGNSVKSAYQLISKILERNITDGYAEKMLKLLDLKEETLEALHSGKVSTGDLLALNDHPLVDTDQAALLLAGERLSRGKQREAVRLILYLADQGEGKWEDFISSSRERLLPLLEALHSWCFPSLKSDLARFRSIIEEMGLPSEAALTPPPSFEGGYFDLRVKIRDRESFSKVIDKLKLSLDAGEIEMLLDILKGERR